ncbi:MAG: nucleotidyl transferase AbiEii/AbiGii toxin family protein [bacterium]
MLNLEEIQKYYHNSQIISPKNQYREYLQFLILRALYQSNIANKIAFLGGTAIRIIHNSHRFSEDLDFDNFGLDFNQFIEASRYVKSQLELEGFVVEIKEVQKGAYHAYIKFPNILYENQLSEIRDEKILIQIDTVSQGYQYTPDIFTLSKFGIAKNIAITPVSILLSQKIYTAFNRKTTKGRDFFDIIYLMAFTKPDYGFLKFKLNINAAAAVKDYILSQIESLNFEQLAMDVQPFLMNVKDSDNVLLFKNLIEKAEF